MRLTNVNYSISGVYLKISLLLQKLPKKIVAKNAAIWYNLLGLIRIRARFAPCVEICLLGGG